MIIDEIVEEIKKYIAITGRSDIPITVLLEILDEIKNGTRRNN